MIWGDLPGYYDENKLSGSRKKKGARSGDITAYGKFCLFVLRQQTWNSQCLDLPRVATTATYHQPHAASCCGLMGWNGAWDPSGQEQGDKQGRACVQHQWKQQHGGRHPEKPYLPQSLLPVMSVPSTVFQVPGWNFRWTHSIFTLSKNKKFRDRKITCQVNALAL